MEMPKIEPQTDGPLLIKGETAIRDQSGTALPSKPVIALCRCGASKSKPYCDGSHVAAGFSSESDKEQLRTTAIAYSGTVVGSRCDGLLHACPLLPCSRVSEVFSGDFRSGAKALG
ncbi:MAG: CDGSH iron-sulfur domain-containing protein [Pseudomonadota bacterium]